MIVVSTSETMISHDYAATPQDAARIVEQAIADDPDLIDVIVYLSRDEYADRFSEGEWDSLQPQPYVEG